MPVLPPSRGAPVISPGKPAVAGPTLTPPSSGKGKKGKRGGRGLREKITLGELLAGNDSRELRQQAIEMLRRRGHVPDNRS